MAIRLDSGCRVAAGRNTHVPTKHSICIPSAFRLRDGLEPCYALSTPEASQKLACSPNLQPPFSPPPPRWWIRQPPEEPPESCTKRNLGPGRDRGGGWAVTGPWNWERWACAEIS